MYGIRRSGSVCWRCSRVQMNPCRNASTFEALALSTKPTSSKLQPRAAPRSHNSRSPFSTSTHHLKKSAVKRKDASAAAEVKASDPEDFAALESGISNVQQRLKRDLSQLRAGGRFNPQVVDDLRVTVDKESKGTVRLGDLAQVVPKGRVLNIIVGEKDHVKAVSSAIAGSNLSLTPQADPHNPLQLNVQVPPPTAEARKQAVQEANKAADTASGALRTVRHGELKRLQAMKKTVRPDDYRRAEEKMEKIVQKAAEENKKIADAARKVLENG